jgi:hypothetical protein
MGIPIIKNNIALTPHNFYIDFLIDLANYYKKGNAEPIEFDLINDNDFDALFGKYHIDPITIPLILSISEQLKKFHKKPIKLNLVNNSGTISLLEFLDRSNFFKITGKNTNPTYPIGKNIFDFDEGYLGNFKGTDQREEHKVRSYSLKDDNLIDEIKKFSIEEDRRDFLVEYYIYKVKDHFSELLFDNKLTFNQHNLFIDILSELITNGVLHSQSDTYALMFVDRYRTKFSISDNGVGLEKSLKSKISTPYYTTMKLSQELSKHNSLLKIPIEIANNLHSIFEALYYSMLKDRAGLFDLMCNVVLTCKGYFRLHTENSQIIISNRMLENLMNLNSLRELISEAHNRFIYGKINKSAHEELIIKYSSQSFELFKEFYLDTIDKYNKDIKFSSVRFYPVKFKGVHIEVEIPNN